jgi:hypothetical protein
MRCAASVLSASGCTAPFGWLPADQARKPRDAPSEFINPSAITERAELPVQMNRTL